MRSSAAHLPEADKEALNAGRYGMAISIMREMGWSWEQLQSTPFDLVQELVIRLAGEGEAHEQKRALEGNK